MYLGDLCLSDNSLGQFVGLWRISPGLKWHEGFFYCDLDCFGRVSSQRGGISEEETEPVPAGCSVSVGSAAAHSAPPLGKGDGRISASHHFTVQFLVAHPVMTES